MKIQSIIKRNYDTIVDAIHNHFNDYMLSPYSYELRMYVDDSGTISFESAPSSNHNEIWEDDHYVLCKSCGLFTVWDYLGDVFTLLARDDALQIIDEIPTTLISKVVVEKYIEDNYPEMISDWLEEYNDCHYDDEVENVHNILDEFIMSLDDFIFEEAEEDTE